MFVGSVRLGVGRKVGNIAFKKRFCEDVAAKFPGGFQVGGDGRGQYVSFYRFFRPRRRAKQLRDELRRDLERIGVVGRVLVSQREGINGQVVVPLEAMGDFEAVLRTHVEDETMFINHGEVVERALDVFPDLRVRTKVKVLNCGFEPGSWDMERNGKHVPPDKWHEMLDEKPDTLILDCRNTYEYEVGRFDGSTGIFVHTFRETFDYLRKLLDGKDRDETKIMMYCTGGIRCEKVGSFVVNDLGFQDVNQLQGGIVQYLKYVETTPGVDSKFKGRNVVFDDRITKGNVRVTEDILGKCHTCGETPHDIHTRCANRLCNRMMLQCPSCAAVFQNTCSTACRNALQPKVEEEEDKHIFLQAGQQRRACHSHAIDLPQGLEEYATKMSSSITNENNKELQTKIINTTVETMDRKQMLSPLHQGNLLQFFVHVTRAKRVLEIGTFTGFSALQMAEALFPAKTEETCLITCDVDETAFQVAKEHLAQVKHGNIQVRLKDGLELIHEELQHGPPFDLIFVDANKRKYRDYYEAILQHNLLAPEQGMMIFDNTLFKGQVLAPLPKQKIATSLHQFNQHIHADPRTVQFLLPMWDGLTFVKLIK